MKGVDAGGAVVLDTLIKSAAERVGVLSEAITQLDEVGGAGGRVQLLAVLKPF